MHNLIHMENITPATTCQGFSFYIESLRFNLGSMMYVLNVNALFVKINKYNLVNMVK